MATKKLQIINGDLSSVVKDLLVDDTFDPTSSNAASGKAVNEAVNKAIKTVYSKTEVDSKIKTVNDSINSVKNNTYTKAEIDKKIASFGGFVVSTTAPSSKDLLWIDPANGLKYHNGTAWVPVPVAYTT